MKDTIILLSFGMGLVTGALMYKYSQCAQKVVDKGEQMAMKEFDMLDEKVDQAIKKAQNKQQGK